MRSAWRIGAQAVGDDERGAALEQAGQALLDQSLALAVEVAGGLVEDQDARVGQQRPGDGQPLALAAAEPHAALADERLVAVVADASMNSCGVGGRRRPAAICAGGPAVAVGDVLGDRAVEQEHVLLDDAEEAAVASTVESRRSAPSRRITPVVGS